ncbi:MAG: GGDEF domain-containing phosphodiesterase [Lachnospiraceae bacterium]|nr:GGDEF domain-containing phosphodiesterase [Lachnospiraceae bacterium]
MKLFKKINLYLLLAIFLFMGIWLVTGALIPTENTRLLFEPPSDFSQGWREADTGALLTDGLVILQKDEVLEIRNLLPEGLEHGNYLAIYHNHLHISAYIDGRMVCETGAVSPLSFGRELGYIWSIIPLTETGNGHEIRLVIQNNGPRHALRLSDFCIGAQSDISFHVLQRNALNLTESSIAALLAFILMIYCCLLYHYRINSYRRPVSLLTLLTINCSIWLFADSSLHQLLSGNPSVRYLLTCFSLLLTPALMLLFARELCHNSKVTANLILVAYLTLLAIFLFLYRFGVLHLSALLPFVHTCILVIVLFISILILREYLLTKKRILIGPGGAFLILCVAVIANYALFFIVPDYDNSMLLHHACLLFLIILFFTTGRESLHQLTDVVSLSHYRQLAYIEPVTQGNSRIRLEEYLRDICARKKDDYWLIHMNLINFKAINETIGWEEGNRLLHEIYHNNKTLLRPGEFQCSLGNANMAFLLRADDLKSLHVRCQQIRDNAKQGFPRVYRALSIQKMFCICKLETDISDFSQILDHALMAKGNPHAEYWQDVNAYIYNDECRRSLVFEQELENDLADALKNGQFEMYLQPKVNPMTRLVSGAEATIRWNHPKYGLMLPETFLPSLEHKNLVSQLDLYLCRQVCSLLKRWQEEGTTPTQISVNFSKLGITQPKVLASYEKLLEEEGEIIQFLEFEFTESAAYDDLTKLHDILDKIHSYGARCCMDDFGSSYSNLNAMRQLSFDSVKLSQRFFENGFPAEERSRDMIRGLIQLFKSLGIKVIAEGIENEQQKKALKDMRCDMIQGYFYSRPVTVPEFEKFRKWTEQNAIPNSGGQG